VESKEQKGFKQKRKEKNQKIKCKQESSTGLGRPAELLFFYHKFAIFQKINIT